MMGLVRRTRWASLVVGFAIWMIVSTTAAVASPGVLAPPGHSGADQYFETIPTAAGNAAPPGSVPAPTTGSGSTGSRSVSGGQPIARLGQGQTGLSRLASLGKAGQAAAALAAATAPSLVRRAKSAVGHAPLDSNHGSVVGGLSRAFSGSDNGGLGLLFPLLLVTALVAAAGITVGRLRQSSSRRPGI